MLTTNIPKCLNVKTDTVSFLDFDKVSYEPFKEWKSKGLQAFLSDDGKNVTRIDFNFTEKEIIEASMKAAGIAPEVNNKKSKRKK